MTDKKFTDEEIVRALRSWISSHDCDIICIKESMNCDGCLVEVLKQTFFLINRQKAEIERLTEDNRRMKKYYYTHDYHECHNEAINEFSEMLKEYLDDFYSTDEDALFDTVSAIDEIAKELTEGKQ